ncbi:MAG: hypothetical protein CW338_01275 [Clostridiales bacterium]|nr:hypothetical protein [Clostridiales bacterium]
MAGKRVKGAVSPFWVLLLALVIIIIGLMIINRQDEAYQVLVEQKNGLRSEYMTQEERKSSLSIELSISGSADYIRKIARQNGYQNPSDIRYVITNPKLLYDSNAPQQEEQQ